MNISKDRLTLHNKVKGLIQPALFSTATADTVEPDTVKSEIA